MQGRTGLCKLLTPLFGCLLLTDVSLATSAEHNEVNIYSYRQPFLIKPILEAFEGGIRDTGKCSVRAEGAELSVCRWKVSSRLLIWY